MVLHDSTIQGAGIGVFAFVLFVEWIECPAPNLAAHSIGGHVDTIHYLAPRMAMMQTTSTTLPQDGVAALQHKPWPCTTQFQHNKYKPYIFASMSIGSNARMLLDFPLVQNLRVSETRAAYRLTDTA